jgi:hypothetical protein
MLLDWRRNNLRGVITRSAPDSEIILSAARIIMSAKGVRASRFSTDWGDRSCLRDKSTSSRCSKAFHLSRFGNGDLSMWEKLRDFAHPFRDERIAGGEPAPVFEDGDPYWRIGVPALHRINLGPLSLPRFAARANVRYSPYASRGWCATGSRPPNLIMEGIDLM